MWECSGRLRPMWTHCSQIANDVITQKRRDKSLRGGWTEEDRRSLGWTNKGPFIVLTNHCLSRPEHKDDAAPLSNSSVTQGEGSEERTLYIWVTDSCEAADFYANSFSSLMTVAKSVKKAALKLQYVGCRGICWYWYIFADIRIVFSCPLKEPITSSEGAGPHPKSPPCCTNVFLQ